jgi:hypothetical protein
VGRRDRRPAARSPDRSVKIVAVEALSGGRGREGFYSTVVEAKAKDVLRWYSMRWSVAVTFHPSKQHPGFEELQGWSERAVRRTAPMAMLVYTPTVHWYALEGHRQARLWIQPWYPQKSRPSFADTVSTLKRLSLQQRISASGLGRWNSKKTATSGKTDQSSGAKCKRRTKVPRLSSRQSRVRLPDTGPPGRHCGPQ